MKYKITLIKQGAYKTFYFNSMLAASWWWVEFCGYSLTDFFDALHDNEL